jgi:hypothetical protein
VKPHRASRPEGPRPVPKRPYRDSAILYGVLSLAVVALAAVTGGSLVRAVVVALGFFVLANTWSWYRWRTRLREERRT